MDAAVGDVIGAVVGGALSAEQNIVTLSLSKSEFTTCKTTGQMLIR